jgi:carboxylesterase type B
MGPTFVIVALLVFLASAAPIVQTTLGAVQGWTDVDGVNWYLGMPYGTVAQRFASSSPAKPWVGVRDARNYGSICYQSYPFGYDAPKNVTMSEDCLTVNVWTPTNTSSSRLPVYFWIYGGALQSVVCTMEEV